MTRTVLRMTALPGREAEFERRFMELDVLGAAARAAGLRSGELLRPQQGGAYMVTATWDGPEAYQKWRESVAREELGTALNALVTPSADPETFEVRGIYPPDRR